MEVMHFTVTALKSFLTGFFVCNLIIISAFFLMRYIDASSLKMVSTVLGIWVIFAVLGYVFDGGFRSIRADLSKGVVQLRIGLGPISVAANEVHFNEVQKFDNHLVFQPASGIEDYDGYVSKLGYITLDGTFCTFLNVGKKHGIMVKYQLTQLLHKYQGTLVEWSDNFLKLQELFRRNSRRHSLTTAILIIVDFTIWLALTLM